MQLRLSTEDVLRVEGGLYPQLGDVVAEIEEAGLLDVPESVLTTHDVLLPLPQRRHIVFILGLLSCILGLTVENLGSGETWS